MDLTHTVDRNIFKDILKQRRGFIVLLYAIEALMTCVISHIDAKKTLINQDNSPRRDFRPRRNTPAELPKKKKRFLVVFFLSP